MNYSRKKLDLTGERYGRLTVLAPAENVGGRTAWLCRCDCGRETIVKSYHLRSRHTKSCGCRDGSGGPRGVPGLTYIDGTCVEMLRARTVRRNNTSGVPGVDWLSKRRRWRATICFQGRRRYLGSFEEFDDAVQARKRAEKTLFDAFLDACDAQQDAARRENPCPPGWERPGRFGPRYGRPSAPGPAERLAQALRSADAD